ncbi:MAG: translation initiation factor IF-2 [Verrucomicrobiaceae bacterium]|nr:translation initiation factor IF-2 [Verrucomicrobiaceae bacterium]
MSIRIHALAKELNVPSKELIDFINQRQDKYGLEIKTSSNSIADLYVEDITNDFKTMQEQAKSAPVTEAVSETPKPKKKESSKKSEEPKVEAKPKVEEKPVVVEKPATPPPPPQAPVVEKPAPVVPPAPKVAVKPAPVVPPVVSKPAPVVPPVASKPVPVVPPMRATPPKISMPAVKTVSAPNKPNKPAPVVPPTPAVSKPKTPESLSQPKSAPSVVLPNISVVRRPAPVVPPVVSKPAPTASVAEQPKAPSVDGLKNLQVKPPIIVREFAKSMDVKPFRLISELMDMGIFASMNQAIEESTAIEIAKRHGFNLDIKRRGEQQQQQLAAEAKKREMARLIVEDIKNFVPRPPIVCILGHVDHGKTTLLDTIRNSHVVDGEAGGITQHTAAYQVEASGGKKITFLDTPGHAAFSKMRERGANVTDIAILVVAADDGFMPQTDEALNFAQKAGVPIVVAINKMDAKGANIDRVKQQMQKRGITSEDWGGEILCQPISALKGENIDKLLDLVLLQAEMMELKANPKAPVEGVIIESQLEAGRGATSTVIVRSGTLKTGDVLVCGEHWCKVRALIDDKGKKINNALPSTPAIVMGWTGAPEAGDTFIKVENDRKAKRITEEAILERKKLAAAEVAPKATSLEDLMAAIENQDQKVFKCIVKSDVSGTVEALVACLNDIKSDKVKLEVISEGVGQITKNDVDFAATAGASIVAFNVKQENGVAGVAKHKGVEFITHNIIYELINQVRDAMKNLLDPELKENKLGAAEVRALFNVSKGGKVAGCMVTEGMIKRDKFARVFRKGKEISKGRVSDLKRFKDDVTEVRAGYECGISLNNFNEFEPQDIIECFEILEIRPDL